MPAFAHTENCNIYGNIINDSAGEQTNHFTLNKRENCGNTISYGATNAHNKHTTIDNSQGNNYNVNSGSGTFSNNTGHGRVNYYLAPPPPQPARVLQAYSSSVRGSRRSASHPRRAPPPPQPAQVSQSYSSPSGPQSPANYPDRGVPEGHGRYPQGYGHFQSFDAPAYPMSNESDPTEYQEEESQQQYSTYPTEPYPNNPHPNGYAFPQYPAPPPQRKRDNNPFRRNASVTPSQATSYTPPTSQPTSAHHTPASLYEPSPLSLSLDTPFPV